VTKPHQPNQPLLDLIARYGSARFGMGATLGDDRWDGYAKEADEIMKRIEEILKGSS